MVPGGLDFASRLFAELCGGEVAPGIVDVRVEQPRTRPLAYRPEKCDALLGYVVSAGEQTAIFRRLECTVEPGTLAEATPSVWTVTPPTFRPDLEREVDLIEEIGRIAGYGRAPATLPRHSTAGGLTPPQEVRRALRRALAACGLDEVITYTFVAPDAAAPLGLPEDDVRLRPVRLSNPMSVEQSVMRTTLLPGLIGALCDNIARLNDPPNLFELGRVYLWDDEVSPAPAHAAEPGRRVAARARGCGDRAQQLAAARGLDRGLSGHRLLHAQGGRRGGRSASFACKASSLLWVKRSRHARTCTPASRRWSASPAARSAFSASCGRMWPAPLAPRALPSTSRRSRWTTVAARSARRAVRGSRRLPSRRAGPGRRRQPRRARRDRGRHGSQGRRQAHSRRARLRRLRRRPGAARQALAGVARRDAFAGAHPEREGHRRRTRQDRRPRSRATAGRLLR